MRKNNYRLNITREQALALEELLDMLRDGYEPYRGQVSAVRSVVADAISYADHRDAIVSLGKTEAERFARALFYDLRHGGAGLNKESLDAGIVKATFEDGSIIDFTEPKAYTKK